MLLKGLHIKLALVVASGAMILASVSSWWMYSRSYELSVSDSTRSVQQLLATLEETAKIAAYVSNTELAQQVVNGLILNDIVLGARLKNQEQLNVVAGKLPSPEVDAQIHIVLHSPFADTESIGELSVMPNQDLIKARASESARATTIGLATHTFIVAFLVLIAVYLMLTRPLVRLSSGLHRIIPGNKERLSENSHTRADEIGLLAKDINRLLDTVEQMLLQERSLRERVQLLEQRFRGIFESSSAGLFLIRPNGSLVTANPAFFRLTSVPDNLLGNQSINCIEHIFAEPIMVMTIIEQILRFKRPCANDLRLQQTQPNHCQWVHALFSISIDNHGHELIEGVLYDITERKIAEESSRLLAEYDHLTQLLNRRSAEQKLDLVLEKSALNGGQVAVMILDLDKFKDINDTYGHDVGDEVLVHIAQRIRTVVRSTDILARLGGDEFMLAFELTDSGESMHRVASSLVDSLGEAITVSNGLSVKVGVSIGVAFSSPSTLDIKTLFKFADDAMYSVKRNGRNAYALYNNPSTPK